MTSQQMHFVYFPGFLFFAQAFINTANSVCLFLSAGIHLNGIFFGMDGRRQIRSDLISAENVKSAAALSYSLIASLRLPHYDIET